MKEDKEQLGNGRDDVATLVRLAGKRRTVPPERAERVRRAAHAQWQAEIEQRSRKRNLWIAATGLATAASLVVAFALGILPFGGGFPGGSGAVVQVESLVGPAWSHTGENTAAPRPLEIGSEVRRGSELETAENSRVAIRLASGHSVRLDRSTKLRLLDTGAIALEQGAIYVDSGPGADPGRAVEVRTALGVVHEIGTQFEVRLADEPSLSLRLREGAAVLGHRDGTDEVRAGTELRLDKDGNVSRHAIDPDGPEWAWFSDIVPMLDLEGRTARVFLEWVARERGLELAFADESVARSAETTVLGGTAGALTLAEALDAVLPTCRMTYRVEQGVLHVDVDSASQL